MTTWDRGAPPPPARTRPYATTAVLDPARGWREASTQRRALAILSPPFALALVFAAAGDGPDDGAAGLGGFLLQILLVPMIAALARVLRPYRSASPPREAVIRHRLAAVAVAAGPVALAMFGTDSGLAGPASVYGAVLAIPLGLATLVWGVIAALDRTSTV